MTVNEPGCHPQNIIWIEAKTNTDNVNKTWELLQTTKHRLYEEIVTDITTRNMETTFWLWVTVIQKYALSGFEITVLHRQKKLEQTLKTSRQCDICLCLLFFTSNGSEEDQYKLVGVGKWRVHSKLPQSMYKSHPNRLRTLGGNGPYIVHLSIRVSISIQNPTILTDINEVVLLITTRSMNLTVDAVYASCRFPISYRPIKNPKW